MSRSHQFLCELCPRMCRIQEGQSGDCRARIAIDGELRAVTYGRPCAVHIDPIEKKPLFHVMPGTRILSIATAGCNLHCKHCQNWTISQAGPESVRSLDLPPEGVVSLALAQQCRAVAYTYTDPVIFYEYALDTSALARTKGLLNVTVTAGYINREPLEMLCKVTDASNTDLKAFSDRFYQEVCQGTLKPVLDCLVTMREHGLWVEVTNLVIPTFNDDLDLVRRMCRWILRNLGESTPLHFSRFHPMYKIRNLPPTPVEFLMTARQEALEIGLHYVYVGNVLGTDAENTICPSDGTVLIRRRGFSILENNLVNGRCPKCGHRVAGIWGKNDGA
ncbi:MAG: AmmeMemoRadiSam system radical SAM enzyme [Desulfomonilaceae bacterium]|nr:AmmeMemoRadiSam system radical SAM enzyme [Desulfomonilaceae bacterium]